MSLGHWIHLFNELVANFPACFQFGLSFFNFLLLIWLGLTVAFNARERSWGTWLASLGLLTGAAFFAAHTVALDFSLDVLLQESSTWWAILSAPVIALPFGWLVLMLWYSGFWDTRTSRLKRRTGIPLVLAGLGAGSMVAIAAWTFPETGQMPFGSISPANEIQFWSVRFLLLIYPAFLVLCTGTALFALIFPAPTGNWRRDASRQRARPYLLASSLLQLVISLGVTLALWRIGLAALLSSGVYLYNLTGEMGQWIDVADVILQMAIAGAVLLLGKAVVSFEIFTGKLLPRRGFWRQWRAVVGLAATYSALIAGAWGLSWSPICSVLLSTACLGAFLAIFSWHSFRERERELARLQGFVAAGHLFEGLAMGEQSDSQTTSRAVDEPLRVLCEELLGAERAALVPGPQIAPLFGAPRVYPAHLPADPHWVQWARATGGQTRALPEGASMSLAIPLGSQGKRGALLLGPRRDGGLYTLEEIELARATGEHLLDAGAATTLTARLGTLQTQKVAEIATLDRMARRRLHDEILPLLHGALLDWNTDEARARDSIVAAHRQISDLLREMPSASPLQNRDLLEALRSEVEVEMAGRFDEVTWDIAPEAVTAIRRLPILTAQTLFFAAREALRNAARYGRGTDIERALHLTITLRQNTDFHLEVRDDGPGLSSSASTSGGSGSGLGLHAALLAVVSGSLEVESRGEGEAETGTTVRLSVPLEI